MVDILNTLDKGPSDPADRLSLYLMRHMVCNLHQELPRNGLVAWTSGNVSGSDERTGLIVIKPSGVRYEDLRASDMSIVTPSGEHISGLRPSTDVYAHLYIYNQCSTVRGIVHTHSPYATAFAAAGRDIPCILTAMADEFGGRIPCLRYATIGNDDIGRAVVDGVRKSGRLPMAFLLSNHGVFTVGTSPESAVKAAVMAEDAARTVWLAERLGPLEELPEPEIMKLHAQYQNYGQPSKTTEKP